MSNLFYPVGLIQNLDIQQMDRTLVDAFENGTTSARSYWAANNFKRIFQITHAPLKPAEFKYLKSFYAQRSGQFDTFWFRDNIGRNGNASVRFSQALYHERHQQVVTLTKQYVNLAEVAPIRALPEFDEVTAAAGSAPVIWYDANREYYLQHCGAVILDPLGQTLDVMGNYRATWQAGTINFGSSIFGQYQYYNFSGVEWAKTAANITQLAGTQPACTIFCIFKASVSAANQVLFSIGNNSTGGALGVALKSSNAIAAWLGGATYGPDMSYTADTFMSAAIAWVGSSNEHSVYLNAAYQYNSSSYARSLVAGPLVLGAAPNGALIANPSNAMANCNLAHVLVFAGNLTLAQIKAVHNLLGYQYGLATVS